MAEVRAALAGDASLTGFYSDMTLSERRTFLACYLGWAFDAVDFMIFPIVLVTIMNLWGVERGPAGFAVTLTLLTSAVGGWLAGYLSDLIGRVRTLQITVIWFSAFTLLSAFAHDFTQLAIYRALLGLGFGGEWAAGAVLMGETIRSQYRGRAVGLVQSAWAVGSCAAVLLQFLMLSWLGEKDAWQGTFIAGALPAFLVIYVSFVKESDLSIAARVRDNESHDRPSPLAIFAPSILGTTVLSSILVAGAQGGYYAITAWLPVYLNVERALTPSNVARYLAVWAIGGFTGYLVGAWFADRYGRRALFLIFSAGTALFIVLYTRLTISDTIRFLLVLPLGFFMSGYFSGLGPMLTEVFPTRLRGSGQGFGYNFGRGVGALFPTLVGYSPIPLPIAMSVFAVLSYGVMFVAALMLPETAGRDIQNLEANDMPIRTLPTFFVAGAIASCIGAISWIAGWIYSSYPFELGGTSILASGTVVCALTLLRAEALLDQGRQRDGHA